MHVSLFRPHLLDRDIVDLGEVFSNFPFGHFWWHLEDSLLHRCVFARGCGAQKSDNEKGAARASDTRGEYVKGRKTTRR